jgi:predicted flap endonuclease-1-like 5' DNA nuclease
LEQSASRVGALEAQVNALEAQLAEALVQPARQQVVQEAREEVQTSVEEPKEEQTPVSAMVSEAEALESVFEAIAETPVIEEAVQDDLEEIIGVGPVVARIFLEAGFNSFEKVAQMTQEDIAKLETKIENLSERIKKEKWIEQAKVLLRLKR